MLDTLDTHACTRTHMCTYAHMHNTHTHTRTHTHTHTHTHTRILTSPSKHSSIPIHSDSQKTAEPLATNSLCLYTIGHAHSTQIINNNIKKPSSLPPLTIIRIYHFQIFLEVSSHGLIEHHQCISIDNSNSIT